MLEVPDESAREEAASRRGAVERGMQALLSANERGELTRPSRAEATGNREDVALAVTHVGSGGNASTRPGRAVGSWVLEGKIGSGGFATVYAARHREISGKRAAIKFLRVEHEDAETLARFEREAAVTSRLAGEHVVHVYDYGVLDGTQPYLVMELVQGRPLESVLRDDSPLSPQRVASIAAQLCRGVSAIHAAGIVHRDLSTLNVIVGDAPTDRIKIIDFGLSKTDEAITRSNTEMGTLPYMSPEVLAGDAAQADARSDIHAVAAIVQELVSGERAFPGPSREATLRQVMLDQPTPVHTLRPGVPMALTEALAPAFAKEPAGRPADAEALWSRIRPALDVWAAGAPAGLDTAPRPEASPPAQSPPDHRARTQWVRWGTAVAGVAVLGLALGWMALRRPTFEGYWRFEKVCVEQDCHSSNGWLHLAADGRGPQCSGAGALDGSTTSWRESDYVYAGHTHALSFQRSLLRMANDDTAMVWTLQRVTAAETPESCGWGGALPVPDPLLAPTGEHHPLELNPTTLSRCASWANDPAHYPEGWHCRSSVHRGFPMLDVDGEAWWHDELGWCRCGL